jgi:hypothetical protein
VGAAEGAAVIATAEACFVDIYEHIAQMKPFIARRDWDGLEASYRNCCEELAGDEQTLKIAALDFASYQAALAESLAEAVEQAQEAGTRAVYFEYDLDNNWQSNFFLCGDYNPEAAGDDDWACDWLAEVSGPEFPEACEVYLENDFDQTPLAKGSTLYLVARTVAAYGRCFDNHPSAALAVCIGFHDQDPIMRLRERVTNGLS